jgi:hypothetical protein
VPLGLDQLDTALGPSDRVRVGIEVEVGHLACACRGSVRVRVRRDAGGGSLRWDVRCASFAVLQLDPFRTSRRAGGVGVWVGVVTVGRGAAEAGWEDAFEEAAARWHLNTPDG